MSKLHLFVFLGLTVVSAKTKTWEHSAPSECSSTEDSASGERPGWQAGHLQPNGQGGRQDTSSRIFLVIHGRH